jgi:hypothetical protein
MDRLVGNRERRNCFRCVGQRLIHQGASVAVNSPNSTRNVLPIFDYMASVEQ